MCIVNGVKTFGANGSGTCFQYGINQPYFPIFFKIANLG